jgi:hypothetical protein
LPLNNRKKFIDKFIMQDKVPVLIAAFDDIQAIVTVCPGIFSGKPALSKAYYEKNK